MTDTEDFTPHTTAEWNKFDGLRVAEFPTNVSLGETVTAMRTDNPDTPDGQREFDQEYCEQLLTEAGWRVTGPWTRRRNMMTAPVAPIGATTDTHEAPWNLERIARELGLEGNFKTAARSARKAMDRAGVKPIGREPGRGGASLYRPADVRAAAATRPGKGTRTDLADKPRQATTPQRATQMSPYAICRENAAGDLVLVVEEIGAARPGQPTPYRTVAHLGPLPLAAHEDPGRLSRARRYEEMDYGIAARMLAEAGWEPADDWANPGSRLYQVPVRPAT